MPMRWRKLLGAIMLIVLLLTWVLLAMAIAQSTAVKGNGIIEVIYYVCGSGTGPLPSHADLLPAIHMHAQGIAQGIAADLPPGGLVSYQFQLRPLRSLWKRDPRSGPTPISGTEGRVIAGPLNQSQPPNPSIITKTEIGNIFCGLQVPRVQRAKRVIPAWPVR
jgi:hypothetical protein